MPHENLYKDFTPASLFKESANKQHAKHIITLRGNLDIYNASCMCNRCGACGQNCPSYKALKAELYSPRGRNQIVRLLSERKLNLSQDGEAVKRTILTCIMCGQCSAVCAVNAPTAALMAEAKTALNTFPGRCFLTSFWAKNPKLYFVLKNLKYKLPKKVAEPKAIYFANAYGLANAKSSLNIITQTKGPAAVIKSGLLLAKAALTEPCNITLGILNNIKAEYDALRDGKDIPVVTDNIEDYRILKQAEAFGAEDFIKPQNILFITDLLKKGQKIKAEDFKDKKILLQDNNIFYHGDNTVQNTADIFNCAKGNFLVKFNPQGPNSTGLLSYTSNIKGADEIKKNIAFCTAKEQADILIVFSAADKKLFERLLKQYYPHTKVLHIAPAAELFYDR